MPTFDEWKKDVLKHKGKIALAILFFAIAIVAVIVSSNYVDEVKTVAVPDLVLDSIPVINLSFLFVWGIVAVFVVYFAYPIFFAPKKFHYALGLLSFFMLVRSAFIVLTHLKAPVDAVQVTGQGPFQIITYSNDLFFSGHAGVPFLGFLVYKNKAIKYFMLTASIVLAATVLLMHVHYSIDVASAYFITYGVYRLGQPLFGS